MIGAILVFADRPGRRGPRHRRGDRRGAPQPPRDSAAHGRREDRRLGAHHRSGGSGGREGPTGQISGGLRIAPRAALRPQSPSDARIAVASGIGSGIGSIFGAPLAGARPRHRDPVPRRLRGRGPAALVHRLDRRLRGVGLLRGVRTALWLRRELPPHRAPCQLVWFAVIGVLGGLIGLLYAKGFYGIADALQPAPVSALGPARHRRRCSSGCIGLAIPEVLGTGYGWIQETFGAAAPARFPSGSCSSCPSRASRRPGSRSVRAVRAASSARAW